MRKNILFFLGLTVITIAFLFGTWQKVIAESDPEIEAIEQRTCDRNNFPKSWWEPVSRDGAPDWEILPQDAKRCEIILSKRTELGILSNFAQTPFFLQGIHYESVEGFWQMMKYPEGNHDPRSDFPDADWKFTRKEVSQMVGFKAKRAGSRASKVMKKMDINWVTFKGRRITYRTEEKGPHYEIILAAMTAKLEQNPAVQRILLETESLILKADHTQSANTPPAWRYYKIWMELRAKLQREQ